jgi:MFS family permease
MVLGWGLAQVCVPACRSFEDLLANRFFLGLFEAGCLPLFSIMTSQWYRRSEQPMRVALWFGMNGVASMVAAVISYGLGHLGSGVLATWQW